MKQWQPTWKTLLVDDSLAAFRDQIGQRLCIASAWLLLPFTIDHLLAGRWVLGAMMLLAQLVLTANGHQLRRRRAPPVPLLAMVSAFGAAITTAVLLQSVHSAFWAFPALFLGYFMLPRQQAHGVGVALVLAVPGAVLWVAGPSAALRALAALLLTLAMINIVLGVVTDLHLDLMQEATTDALTGAWNRRHFDAQLATMRAPLEPGRKPNVLLMLDIDHFKAVNDRHGHGVGDQVLKNLVLVLNQRRREADQLFRIGGEEFVLLLPRTSADDAHVVAETLRQRVEEADLAPCVRVTVSIGLSVQNAGHVDQPWLAAADKALYEAKRSGRNRVVIAPVLSSDATAEQPAR